MISSLELSELPASFMNLLKGAGVNVIMEFDFHSNDLKDLISESSEFHNLRILRINDNRFQELPLVVFAFSKLQGFEEFMEYLRDVYEQQQLEDLIRKRPPASVVGSFKKLPTTSSEGLWPRVRSGHSITQAGSATYIFGGNVGSSGKVDDLFSIDVRTLLWVKRTTHGIVPAPRDNHAAAFDGRKRLYIFGGRNGEQKLLNDTYYLDLKNMTWYQPTVEGATPSVREGASIAVVGSQVVLFGGRGSKQRHNDLHTLCTQTWTWTPCRTKGSIPSPRQNAALAISGTNIYIHGGKGNLTLEDLHVVDLVGLVWYRVLYKGENFSARHSHTATIQQKKFYVFGGVDKTDQTLTSLFELPLGTEGKTESFQSSQVETFSEEDKPGSNTSRMGAWKELNSELPFNNTYTYCFHEDKLLVFQNDDDTVHGESMLVWNVYMEAKIACFQPKALHEEKENFLDSKTSRVKKMQTKYELLEDPTQFPVYLPSSRTILKWQKGDCFDFSIALVSLLAGAGYEAYCVAGYAPLALTSNNQESCSCPVANEEKQIKSTHLPMEGREDLKYSVKSVPILNSHYFEKVKRERDSTVSRFVENFKLNFDQELQLGQNEEDDNLVRFCLEKSSADIPAEEVSETHLNVNGGLSTPGSKVKFDETCSIETVKGTPTAIHATNLSSYLDKYRIHCWVIIFGGKQGISENIFVEPSTGNHYPLLGSPYQGVEFIWNQSNLWINMQANPRRSGLDKMSWDLRDTTKWERILSGSKIDNHIGDSNNIAVNTILRSPRLQESYTSDSSHLTPTGIIKPDGVHFEHLKERIFTETSDKALKQSSRGNTGNKSKSATEKKLSDDLSDNTEGVTDSYHFLLPPSWVPKLEIPVDAFVTR
ncbi:hypothetical protein O6H91_02G040200 [Diphasiastrum complanatum]|uniref:Uncharacterized protein n=1 Tax=Diphasiastrum complanatum TaxID=34168 RepID=A0ACC2EEZ3_DIPCM|nr:hypothetical protein O6H91_02G040200 [Diphasiastrum complanatum]